MTVKELKSKLEHLPESMEVFIAEIETGFQYNLLNEVVLREINFSEEPDGRSLSKDTVVVLEAI